MQHTVNTWFRFLKEISFGGGKGGGPLVKTKAALWTELTLVCPYIMGEQTMPFMKFDREEVQAAGDDIEDVTIFNKDKTAKDSGHKYYIQSSEFLEATLSGTAGTPGDSYLCHWKKPEGEFEAYGMIVQEWAFDFAGKGNFPSEAIKWKYFDVDVNPTPIVPSTGSTEADGVATVSSGTFASAAADFVTDKVMPFDILEILEGVDKGRYLIVSVDDLNTLTVTPNFATGSTTLDYKIIPMKFRTNQPLTTHDITLKVDTVSVNIKGLTFTIGNEFQDSSQSGEWIHGEPGVLKRTTSGNLTVSSFIADLIDDEVAEIPDLHDLELTLGSLGVLTLHNVIIEATNIENIPEFGMYEFTADFKQGTGFSSTFVPS